MFYLISTGWRDESHSGSLVALGDRGTTRSPNIFADNSRFGEFNSRLDRLKFAVRTATGIGWEEIDLAHYFRGQTAGYPGKIDEIPGFDGKNREFGPQRRNGLCARTR